MNSTQIRLSFDKIVKLIQAEGLLTRAFKGFEPRLSQQQMMSNIIDAYNHNQIALIEAGTGTGKSLAYLIPAMLWAANTTEKTVISTNTITLQEQLVNKDIPQLARALNLSVSAVLVKGMNNYLCLRKFEDARLELPLVQTAESEELDQIETWRRSTVEGSRSDLPFIPTSSTWDKIGAESEACSHNQCPYYQECFFFKARRQAQDAHLLVVNHHLLFADVTRRAENENYTETAVLPAYKRIIIDEAHHIEEIATEYFAQRLHRIELLRLLARLTADKHHSSQGKLLELKDRLHQVFRKDPPTSIGHIISRLTIDLPAIKHQLVEQIHLTFDAFARFMEVVKLLPTGGDAEEIQHLLEQKLRLLEAHHRHPLWSEEIIPQTQKLIEFLKLYNQSIRAIEADLKLIKNDKMEEHTKSVRTDIQGISFRVETAVMTLNHFLNEWKDTNRVKWIELHRLNTFLNVHLVDAELDISDALVNNMFNQFATIILCSATLTSNRRFSFIKQRLGLTHHSLRQRKITENIYDSLFNYSKQALLAIPLDMPQPSHSEFNRYAFENIWKAIEACQGQAFVLFTSYQMLHQCQEYLEQRFKTNRYPLFRQGQDSRQKLLQRFKNTKRAILFGTDSFWEGVDVAGDALRCVIIVKLPFKVPSDPLIQARTEDIAQRGGDPFYEFSIPHAIVKFKQGFGRLIRHQSDRGCIVCLDNRIVTKGYGKLFLNSLPNCEKAFLNSNELWPKVADFYKKTFYFVKQNPFSK